MKSLNFCLFLAVLTICFTGCSKPKEDNVDHFPESAVHADDQARYSTELDAAINDVNFALEMTRGFTGKAPVVLHPICDATIEADTLSNPRVLTLTYNRNSCLGARKRSGKIVISMDAAKRWKDPGAAVTVDFQNFTSTRIKDNKDIVFNNKVLVTNVSGGVLNELSPHSNITHTIFSADLDLTFDNGKEWSWKTARKRVYHKDNGIVISTTGTHAGGDLDDIADWGNNRFGRPFLTPILLPLVARQDCSFRVVEGKTEIILTDRLYATAKWGLDWKGNPVSCRPDSSYYMEMLWRDYQGSARIARVPY